MAYADVHTTLTRVCADATDGTDFFGMVVTVELLEVDFLELNEPMRAMSKYTVYMFGMRSREM